ncbi:PD-(D/E)XK nuclease family protein [Pontimicrobium aquaticum]|uniref:PD-(D/E)XK nuclease family protein n=1 Tax=Pontimicrobium aquaticum TaxID=2565367 RepID=A0A4U0F199_9FLAO|nr:PD-(D/E)XK nuclease family protein [Pontimicrobium aquaticum]TJY38197.1 PD-(D/E)XK nuclease family protein [Pontimicrobium aquaticum]
MPNFISDVLKDLEIKEVNLSNLTFILPSKRAGVFLRNEIATNASKTIFAPSIISIEEFVEELSQLKKISNTELLFEFYSVYKSQTPIEQIESFETFSKWARMLLQDFNEVDRYLIEPKSIFKYLSDIKDINHWALEKNQTPLITNYLAFWKRLFTYYSSLVDVLIKKGKAYQGLIYREAVESLESYIQLNENDHHVFLGFNALNNSESLIIQELLQSGLASVYWDIDELFLNNTKHDAGYFIRQHKNMWTYLKSKPFQWSHKHYSEQKNMSVIGIPKNVGQAKYVGEILSTLKSQKGHLNNTAVVLGDETLLLPVLNSLPDTVEALNITMGFPLKSIPLASLFDQLFLLHKDGKSSFYYKDVIAILSHSFIRSLFIDNHKDFGQIIIDFINENNLVNIDYKKLLKLAPQLETILTLLFKPWSNNPSEALHNCLRVILEIKAFLVKNKKENLLALEYLYRFNEVFNTLTTLNSKYKHIISISALYSVYNELLSFETLDFKGEPLKGLQIMGMLESRVLDFETVIITSVNEGILPSGKSNNSFIPYDVKLENKLPTYKEKDAVYTYHFYRLIQRSKNVFILYNTEPDVINGGEKSRFITQLEVEGIHNIQHKIITPITPKIFQELMSISKTDDVISTLKSLSKKGLSPSSLTNYIRNPLDFYYQKILGIKEVDDVEETVAANTLGTVVHNTLEDLYKPFENAILNVDLIKNMTQKVENTVQHHFKNIYKDGDITKGKNLIIYEIAKRYVTNFLNEELKDLEQGNRIKIIEVEADLSVNLNIDTLDFPVTLKGKVDRIDEYNGTLRIIDYKTGKVEQSQVEVVDWDIICTDYKKYSKSFQVLMYAYMLHLQTPFKQNVEAGIISFKNLSSGFLKFGKKEKPGSRNKNTNIDVEVLNNFENELKKLILEIYNPNIDFIEKEIE